MSKVITDTTPPTLGPWGYDANSQQIYQAIGNTRSPFVVLMAPEDPFQGKPSRYDYSKFHANGRLMAAAPVMRDALRRIVEVEKPREIGGCVDGGTRFLCWCGAYARTSDEIKHADGCAYVIARDALAAIEETK